MSVPVCLACGEVLLTAAQRMLLVCDECQWDAREDDHDVHTANMQTRAVDA